MKKIVYLCVMTIAVTVLTAGSAYKSAGPPGCYAGEPPGNNNCTSCHSDFSVNTGTANILFDIGGADTGYVPGQTYDITISVKKSGLQAAGFQFTALLDHDLTKSPGILTLSDPARTQIVDSANPHVQGCGLLHKAYVEHTYQGILSDASGESKWNFKWQAPSNYVGDITFYLSTLESNYSGDEFGDNVYTRKILSKDKTTGISQIGTSNAGISIFPNPAFAELHVKTGTYSIQNIELVNMQGVTVKQYKDIEQSHRTTYVTIDISGVCPGLYFVSIKGNELNTVEKVVVQ